MAAGFRAGLAWCNYAVDAFLRGSVATPPATMYFSLGATSDATINDEIPSIVRTPVQVSRWLVNGTNANSYWHQSSGTNGGFGTLLSTREPIDIFVPEAYAGSTGIKLMVFDAAVGGNLLFATANIAGGNNYNDTISQYGVPGGFVVRVGMAGYGTNYHNGYLFFFSDTSAKYYVNSMLLDWLVRGYDSINQLFSVATYPNIYAELRVGGSVVGSPIAIPRAAGQWSALTPTTATAADGLPRYKFSNLNTLTFGPAGAARAGTPEVYLRMASSAQSFVDTIAQAKATASNLNLTSADSVSFAAGALEFTAC